MSQSGKHSLNNIFSLGGICHFVDRDGFEDVDLTPLVRVGNGGKNLVQVLTLLEWEVVLVGSLGDLKDCCARISNHDCITVQEKSLKGLDKLVVFHEAGRSLVELCYGRSCCLLHIRIVILQGIFERLAEILSDALNADAAHCPDCKSTH